MCGQKVFLLLYKRVYINKRPLSSNAAAPLSINRIYNRRRQIATLIVYKRGEETSPPKGIPSIYKRVYKREYIRVDCPVKGNSEPVKANEHTRGEEHGDIKKACQKVSISVYTVNKTILYTPLIFNLLPRFPLLLSQFSENYANMHLFRYASPIRKCTPKTLMFLF